MEPINILKALADETRLRILHLLNKYDLCVCEIKTLLNLNQSNVSRHLNRLTSVNILEYYKVSKYVYYKISDEIITKYPFIHEVITEHAKKISHFNDDYNRMIKYKQGGYTCDDLMEGKVCFQAIDQH